MLASVTSHCTLDWAGVRNGLHPALWRFEHRSHVVFYTEDANGVLIVRVLHARMDAPRHF